MEPWIGTGVFANAFGCEYHFRDDNAPHVRYRYHKIEEVRDIEYPDYRKSPIMSMVLDCIDCFRERTHDGLPIALTDTQSPFDTATLILDAAEFFTACYTEPEIVTDFLQKITDLIVEFSEVQMRADRARIARAAGTPHAELRRRAGHFHFRRQSRRFLAADQPPVRLADGRATGRAFRRLGDPFLRRLDAHDVDAARLPEHHGHRLRGGARPRRPRSQHESARRRPQGRRRLLADREGSFRQRHRTRPWPRSTSLPRPRCV